MKKIVTILLAGILSVYLLFSQESKSVTEFTLGESYYDVQTSRAMQDRIFRFDDGTIGSVFNQGMNAPGFSDLGIGYNYYDGNAWGPEPTQSITSGRAVNPSYSNYGENGEIVVSEGENGLYINYRINRGTGPWQEIIFPGPAGCTHLYSPQVVTSGPDDQVIHIFALCKDESQQLNFQDNIGKVLYSRSTDGGTTWDPQNYYFNFNDDYFGFSEMALSVAEPRLETLAFIVGDYFTDLVLMKSTDGGNTWQKTIIVEHPYPYMEFGSTVTDTFWTHSGSMDITLDLQSKANVVFSLCHIKSEVANIWYYDPWSDGIVYWNEDMPAFSDNINALNPYNHPDSELTEDYNLVAWVLDLNGNGEIDFLPFNDDNPPFYPTLGLCTMPTIAINDVGIKFLLYSMLTEMYDNGSSNFRHIWSRTCSGPVWSDFVDLTSSLIHIFDECVFPTLSTNNLNDYIHLTYQFDLEPGPTDFSNGGIFPINSINYMKFDYEIIPSPFAYAFFWADETSVIEGDTVHFINMSTGYPSNNLYYAWEFEGGTPAASSETNPEVVYNVPGTYDVKLTTYVSPSVFDESLFEDFIIVEEDVGLQEKMLTQDLEIYPNPAKAKIHIRFTHAGDFNFEIRDLLGKLALEGYSSVGGQDIVIDTGDLLAGVYFITVAAQENTITKKLVVNH